MSAEPPYRSTRPRPDPAAAEPSEEPARNGAGWLGLALSAAAFLVSVFSGDQGSVLVAALGLAFGVTGLARVYRRTATNKSVALAGVVLALMTFAMSTFWYVRSQPCTPLRPNLELFQQCVDEHSGLL